jgi:hypothetical protein
MAANWNTIERKANGKLTENAGTECERDLTPHYLRWAKPWGQVTSFTIVVYFIDNPCVFMCVCLTSALLRSLHNLNN